MGPLPGVGGGMTTVVKETTASGGRLGAAVGTVGAAGHIGYRTCDY